MGYIDGAFVPLVSIVSFSVCSDVLCSGGPQCHELIMTLEIFPEIYLK